MKTIIVYATKYGCTEKCATMLSEKLLGEVDLLNLKDTKDIDLTSYDKVIIGGSIYIGKIQKEVSGFCTNHLEALKNKAVGLFICAMHEEDVLQEELDSAFPQDLNNSAIAKACFGGEFIFKKMNFMERLIVKKVSKIDKDMSTVSEEAINKFAKSMNGI